MANIYGNDPFFNNDMDDIFNQVFRRMGNSESARYVINGRELSPDEFAQYRATVTLPKKKKLKLSKMVNMPLKKVAFLKN